MLNLYNHTIISSVEYISVSPTLAKEFEVHTAHVALVHVSKMSVGNLYEL